jgi:type IV secretory pathway TrbF-like protein
VNKLFRRPDQVSTRHDDIVERGYQDWDARIGQAIASQNAWKRGLYLALVVLGGSVAGNIWLAEQTKVQVVHVVHDSLGGVIAVSVSTDKRGEPTDAMLKASMEDWITNVRTVYIDVLAMRRSILQAYDLVAKGSQAAASLSAFYNGRDPFKRSDDETVSIEDVVAVPPTSATIGTNGMQTWGITWNERVSSRDGENQSVTHWAGNVTFKLETPATVADATRNPNGIHIVGFSWTGSGK